MKIALNIEHFDLGRGGAERYVYDLAREMAEEGHEVHIFSRDGRPCPDGKLRLHIVPAIKWPRIISAISFIVNSSREIKKDSFDIVHVFGKNTYMNIFQPLGGSHKASFIQNLRSIENPLLRNLRFLGAVVNLKKILFFYLERIQVKSKDKLRIIAISKMVKDAFIKYYSFPEDNIDIVYNGVDLSRYHPRNRTIYRKETRDLLGIDDNKLVLIFIANNFRLKGLHSAIRTLASLEKETRKGYFKLLVVGGGKRKKFLRLAKHLNCAEDIIFAGLQSNIEKYLGASDICFQPTFYDPASLVVLEALASGVPVVTTRYNGMGEIITDKEGSVADDPRDIKDLSNKIMYLKDKLDNCSKAARRLAEQFPMENNYKRVLESYRKIVET